jgi:hypothetical protein
MSKQNLNPIGAYGTLKIVKNEIKLRKLWPPKVEGARTKKKQTTKCYKGRFLNTQKIPCMLFYCYKSSKMICRTLGGAPIAS